MFSVADFRPRPALQPNLALLSSILEVVKESGLPQRQQLAAIHAAHLLLEADAMLAAQTGES